MVKVTFHRNGTVSVEGKVVGEFRQPDPSGAAHARTPVWVFKAHDGRCDNARTRGQLDLYAIGAARRLAA